jgi:phage/plasmid-like protein (TIGR03299 family)
MLARGVKAMSHEIEANEHYVYALADGLPWHGLGIQQAARMTLDDVVKALPRMAETPILCRVFYKDPSNQAERVAKECDSKRAIVYPSDGTYIGMATATYQPKSFADAFERAFGWVESLGAWVSGAALLRGGSRAFIMARLPELDFTVEEDKHAVWLSVFAGSDGQTGIYPHITTVREVCANTVGMGLAESKKNGRAVSIAHHGNVNAKLAEASVALSQIAATRDAYGRACEMLLSKAISRSEEQELVKELIDGDSTRSGNARDAIVRLAHFGRGNRRYEGTAYALWQGVTDYVDHEAVKTSQGNVNERRFLYSVEGAGAALKARALELLTEYAPEKSTEVASEGNLLDAVLAAS